MNSKILRILIIPILVFISVLLFIDPIKNSFYERRFRKSLSTEKLKEYLEKISVYDEKYAENCYNRGLIKNEFENYIGAKYDFSRAIKIIPYEVPAAYYYQRGEAIAAIGSSINNNTNGYRKAIKDFSKAISIFPNYREAYEIRGYVKLHLKDLKGAMSDLSKAISINPQSAALSYSFRGETKYELNDFSGSIDDYTQALNLDKNYNHIYFRRGKSYEQLKRYDEAISDFLTYTQLWPNDGEGYFKLGMMEIYKYQIGHGNGCKYLSKAGELGYEKAYEFIKLYCN